MAAQPAAAGQSTSFPIIDAVGTALKANETSLTDLSILPAHPMWSNFVLQRYVQIGLATGSVKG